MKLLGKITFIAYIICLVSCKNAWHPEKSKQSVEGCWHSFRDTLKFDTAGNFIYTGLSSYGWISESKGNWKFDGTYFVLNGDSVYNDSLNRINEQALEYAKALVATRVKGKNAHVPRSLLFSDTKPLYRNFHNEQFRMQGDTLLLQINENGFEVNRYKRCESNK